VSTLNSSALSPWRTEAPTRQGMPRAPIGDASSIACVAVSPASRRFHDAATPVASGVTSPRPVTTTRRRGFNA
jgi:hypothetical protein